MKIVGVFCFFAFAWWFLAVGACAYVPEPPSKLKLDPSGLTVDWEVRSCEVAQCSNQAPFDVKNFPSGYRCFYNCANHEGTFVQVWVPLFVNGGCWRDPSPHQVCTAPCYSDAFDDAYWDCRHEMPPY